MASGNISHLETDYKSYLTPGDAHERRLLPDTLCLTSEGAMRVSRKSDDPDRPPNIWTVVDRAFPGSGVVAEVVFPAGASRLLPRGMPWSAYPATPAPVWGSPPRGHMIEMTVYGDPYDSCMGTKVFPVEAAGHARRIALHRFDGFHQKQGPAGAQVDYWIGCSLEGMVEGLRGLPLLEINGRIATPLGPWDQAVASLKRPWGPSERFFYQYQVNAITIFGRAFSKALQRAGSPPGARAGHLSDPMWLQMLYRAASGTFAWEGARHLPSVRRHDMSPISGMPDLLDASEPEAVRLTVRLSGSGKYPALPASRKWVSTTISDLITCGWIVADRSGLMLLTELGKAFLDVIHADSDDPDMLLRWRDPTNGLITCGKEDLVDAWIRRFFGKTKNKMDRN